MIAGGDQGTPGKNRIPIGRFLYLDVAIPVQTIGEGTREELRHVLNDHDTRTAEGHGLQEFANCFRATGGGSDRNDLSAGKYLVNVLRTNQRPNRRSSTMRSEARKRYRHDLGLGGAADRVVQHQAGLRKE